MRPWAKRSPGRSNHPWLSKACPTEGLSDMPGPHLLSTYGGAFREREDEEVEWKPSCVVHLTRPEGGDLAAMRACFNLKDTLKTTFFVGSADGELVYADWIKPEVSLP